MIGNWALAIARVLASKAKKKSRVTYKQVGQDIGWGHPEGRSWAWGAGLNATENRMKRTQSEKSNG